MYCALRAGRTSGRHAAQLAGEKLQAQRREKVPVMYWIWYPLSTPFGAKTGQSFELLYSDMIRLNYILSIYTVFDSDLQLQHLLLHTSSCRCQGTLQLNATHADIAVVARSTPAVNRIGVVKQHEVVVVKTTVLSVLCWQDVFITFLEVARRVEVAKVRH